MLSDYLDVVFTALYGTAMRVRSTKSSELADEVTAAVPQGLRSDPTLASSITGLIMLAKAVSMELLQASGLATGRLSRPDGTFLRPLFQEVSLAG